MTVTAARKRVLELVADGLGPGTRLPKSHFDTLPTLRRVAKDLLWEGFLTDAGRGHRDLELTDAGRCLREQAA
jgi:hypothetical protein